MAGDDTPEDAPVLIPQPTTAQLRPALQLAIEVARTGGRVPGRIRSITQARRPPANWTGTARRVLEDDEAFRGRVAGAATEAGVGRLAWLWLARPDGWIDGLREALAEEAGADGDGPVKEENPAVARLSEVEPELARTQAQLAALQTVNAELSAELENERRSAAAAARHHQKEVERMSKTSADREREADELRLKLQASRGDLERLSKRLEMADIHYRQALEDGQRSAEAARAAEAESERLAEALGHQKGAVGGAISRAAAAAHDLGAALAEAGRALGGTSDAADAAPEPPTARSRRRVPTRRVPLGLPPAVLDDSPEAAAHLVRAPGVLLIVDGYNVGLTSWGDLELPELRRRLLDALAELAIRIKVSVLVVFDGTASGGRVPAPAAARPWMRVEFSPSNVEADAVIVDAVDDLPADRPAVVATNDLEVQRAVRRRGANVIGVNQLLSELGRRPAGGR